ncbi:MAG: hypothetical protein V1685_02180 [Parcubacteria group bacterium]
MPPYQVRDRLIESGMTARDMRNSRHGFMPLFVYILKVDKRDGKLVNTVIDKTATVSQADVWKYWRK